MNPEEERFLKIPKDKWKYELESGKIAWEELNVLLWLWLKANPMTGKVAVDYSCLAEEMKNCFSHIRGSRKNKKKALVNKLNKIMLSLKGKERLWFREHSGSNKPVELELHEFPLIQQGYTDISHRFQQRSSRSLPELTGQNGELPAELPKIKESLEVTNEPENNRETEPVPSSPIRGSKRENKDKEKREPSLLLNSSLSPEKEKPTKEELQFWNPDDVWEYCNALLLRRKGAGLPELSQKANSLIRDFLDKYGPERVAELIDYYLNSEECEKDRQKMGITLAVIFGEVVIGRWLNSLNNEEFI